MNTWVLSGRDFLNGFLKTKHGLFVSLGCLTGLLYFPSWLAEMFVAAKRGSTAYLILAMLGLAAFNLVKDRKKLLSIDVSEEDQLIGHILIVTGVLAFPFFRFALWSQGIIWAWVLIGIALSSWGMGFFSRYLGSVTLISLSVYPKLGVLAKLLWETFLPPEILERTMAYLGGVALRLLGQSAVVEGIHISLPSGSVEVGWGCNGFTMAATMAGASLLLGLYLKLDKLRMLGIVLVGACLALIANVPRIVLLSYAAVYWDQKWFDFWHHEMGGQIFVGVMFTIYYYLVTWLFEDSSFQA